MTSKIKKILFFFILINYISFSQSDEVKTVNYNELKPLINKSGEKTYVVNFWATWCAPCIKEIPYYEELNKDSLLNILNKLKEGKEVKIGPQTKKRKGAEPINSVNS